MALTSAEANLYQGILTMLAGTGLRYIEQDLGQLEHYDLKPPVSFPCCLIDIEEIDFSDTGKGIQIAQGIVTLRIGMVQYTSSSNLTPTNIRENALQYYELENTVFKAMHGKNVPGFSKFLRRKAATEKRNDDIRVRIVKYAVSYTDDSALPGRQSIARPEPSINTTNS